MGSPAHDYIHDHVHSFSVPILQGSMHTAVLNIRIENSTLIIFVQAIMCSSDNPKDQLKYLPPIKTKHNEEGLGPLYVPSVTKRYHEMMS